MASIAALSKNPTFRAKVGIPQAGEADVEVGFTFKYRTKAELDAFDAKNHNGKRPNAEIVLDMVDAWDFDEPLNTENIELLLQKSIGAGVCIHAAYKAELVKVRLGN